MAGTDYPAGIRQVQDNGNQDNRCHQCSGVADNQCRAHADMYFLTVEFSFYQFRSLFGNRLQSFDKQRSDAGDEFHYGSHCDTQEENFLDVELGCPAYQHTYDNSQYQRFAYYTELFLPSF